MTKFSFIGEVLAIAFYGFSFGGWIGMIFSENEGLPLAEIIVYNIHHSIVSGLAALILSISGRYDIRRYSSFCIVNLGAILFTLYERWILLPMSLLTWANLNHSLCGVHNDPFYEMF